MLNFLAQIQIAMAKLTAKNFTKGLNPIPFWKLDPMMKHLGVWMLI